MREIQDPLSYFSILQLKLHINRICRFLVKVHHPTHVSRASTPLSHKVRILFKPILVRTLYINVYLFLLHPQIANDVLVVVRQTHSYTADNTHTYWHSPFAAQFFHFNDNNNADCESGEISRWLSRTSQRQRARQANYVQWWEVRRWYLAIFDVYMYLGVYLCAFDGWFVCVCNFHATSKRALGEGEGAAYGFNVTGRLGKTNHQWHDASWLSSVWAVCLLAKHPKCELLINKHINRNTFTPSILINIFKQ